MEKVRKVASDQFQKIEKKVRKHSRVLKHLHTHVI